MLKGKEGIISKAANHSIKKEMIEPIEISNLKIFSY